MKKSKGTGLKIILIFILALSPFLLLIFCSINFNQAKYFSAVGSSGVKPFVENFYFKYKNEKQNKNMNISVETGGSGFGIEQVANGYAAIGNSSTNPYDIVKNAYSSLWQKSKIKTITIGWEGICLIYIPPKGLSPNAINSLDLFVNNENINHLLATFSGFNELRNNDWKDEYATFYHYLSPNALKELDEQDKNICKSTPIIPYVRSGGSLTSGTASAFYNESHFDDAKSSLTQRQIKAFTTGSYGKDRKVYETDEANSRAWDMFLTNKLPGSIVYLSSGFIQANKQLLIDNGFKIFSYQAKNKQITNYNYDVSTISNGYNWFRPLNCCIWLNNQYIKNFISWIFFCGSNPYKEDGSMNLDNYHNFITSIGANSLNIKQIESMCLLASEKLSNNNFWQYFWSNDYDLDKQRQDLHIFGAIS